MNGNVCKFFFFFCERLVGNLSPLCNIKMYKIKNTLKSDKLMILVTMYRKR